MLVLGLLLSEVAMVVPWNRVQEAEAGVPVVNAVVGFFRILGAFGARRAVYREAGRTTAEVNAYYDRLIEEAAEARREIYSRAAAGERLILARSYIRIEAMLRAEKKAAIAMIEAEKNTARKNFDRTVAKAIVNIMIAAPGPQKVIGDIRQSIRGAREAAVAVQAALEGGKPIEALGDALSKKVGGIAVAQELARGLGSMVGRKIDRALGGVATRMETMLGNMQAGLGEGIGLLDQMDAEVAVHDNRERHPVSLVEDAGMIKEVFTVDRKNPIVDVVASAFAGGAFLGGNLGGMTRGEMGDRIRDTMLAGRINRIQSIAARNEVGTTYCVAVAKGTYELAAQQLGQTPQQARDPELAAYLVCYDIQSNLPAAVRLVQEQAVALTGEPPAVLGPAGAQIPVGVYIGTITWTNESIVASMVSITSEIIINVDADGTVNGTSSAKLVTTTEECQTLDATGTEYSEIFLSATYTGTMGEIEGIIQSMELYNVELHSTCPGDTTIDPLGLPQALDIRVDGDTMTGSIRGTAMDEQALFNYIFTAIRQN
jgi:hypothetical protein